MYGVSLQIQHWLTDELTWCFPGVPAEAILPRHPSQNTVQ